MSKKQEEISVSTNGHGPQIKRREKWIELPDEYEGFKALVWVNAPSKLWLDLNDEDEEIVKSSVMRLVLEHNGWRDFDGEVYPTPNSLDFWEQIPTELAGCLFAAMQTEMTKLPNSIAPQRRRSKRG